MIAETTVSIHEPPARSLARTAPCGFSRAGVHYLREKPQMSRKIQVKPGDRYGRLTVIKEIDKRSSPTNGKMYRIIECRCSCGTIKQFSLESLRKKNPSRSCGCLQREIARVNGLNNRTHGLTHCPAYESWSQMKQRCYNKKDPQYHNYGQRGIAVCGRWLNSFEAFLEDMGERPSLLYSIDRYPDKEGNYEPSNCRWATSKQQARNRRSNVMLTFQGETMCMSAWAEHIGIPRKTLEKRLNCHGFSVEEALTLPLRARRKTSGISNT